MQFDAFSQIIAKTSQI